MSENRDALEAAGLKCVRVEPAFSFQADGRYMPVLIGIGLSAMANARASDRQ